MDITSAANEARNPTARRPVSPPTVTANNTPNSPTTPNAEGASTQVSTYTVIDPADSSRTGPRPALFTTILRSRMEEIAAPLVPDFTMPTAPIPNQADLDVLTGAMNLLAVRTGALWTIPAAYSGQLADTVINAVAANTPPTGRKPGHYNDDSGDNMPIEPSPSPASGGSVSL